MIPGSHFENLVEEFAASRRAFCKIYLVASKKSNGMAEKMIDILQEVLARLSPIPHLNLTKI